MKFSLFNSIVSLTEKYNLIYNSYSDSFLILSKRNAILDDIEILKKHDSELYEKLLQNQFIINENVDEISLVKKLQQNIDHNLDQYHLTINPTLDCNFKCWYCYESKVLKSRVSEETTLRIKKFIVNIINSQPQLQHFSLNFFGGEPFLNFTFVKEIIHYLTLLCEKNENKRTISLSISFTTNGYLLNENIINELSKFNISCLQITLDGNREQHNTVRYASKKIGSYDIILKNIKLLLKKNIGVILRINYTSDNISNIVEILNDLKDIDKKSKLDIQFHRVWQDNSTGINIDNQVDEVIESFRIAGFITYTYPLNNVKSPCYADKINGALINFNGDIFRCTAMNFSKDKREGYLDDTGNIIWEENAFEKRKQAKFKNNPCLNCRILPICNGGCSQKAIEYESTDYCILNFKEEEKDRAILTKFKYYLKYFPNFIKKIN